MQIDNPDRGFSYKYDGPLDLRLDQTKGEPASERLKHVTRDEFEGDAGTEKRASGGYNIKIA